MKNLAKTSENISVCDNKDLPLELRTGVNGIPKGILSEESFEYACYLCDGRNSSCSLYK